jgi:hypothetical protein
MKRKLSVKGQIISLQKCNIETQDSGKKWGGFIESGCKAKFIVKTLPPLPHVSKINMVQRKHINIDGFIMHKDLNVGKKFAFSTHLSQQMKEVIM